mmetsp:Transcript_118046/g.220605  ORF Transcript_118046/g.220605 Transcript_118046/m.220605 type:complete len:342 (+) Transcript_118046:888-1913(+)
MNAYVQSLQEVLGPSLMVALLQAEHKEAFHINFAIDHERQGLAICASSDYGEKCQRVLIDVLHGLLWLLAHMESIPVGVPEGVTIASVFCVVNLRVTPQHARPGRKLLCLLVLLSDCDVSEIDLILLAFLLLIKLRSHVYYDFLLVLIQDRGKTCARFVHSIMFSEGCNHLLGNCLVHVCPLIIVAESYEFPSCFECAHEEFANHAPKCLLILRYFLLHKLTEGCLHIFTHRRICYGLKQLRKLVRRCFNNFLQLFCFQLGHLISHPISCIPFKRRRKIISILVDLPYNLKHLVLQASTLESLLHFPIECLLCSICTIVHHRFYLVGVQLNLSWLQDLDLH